MIIFKFALTFHVEISTAIQLVVGTDEHFLACTWKLDCRELLFVVFLKCCFLRIKKRWIVGSENLEVYVFPVGSVASLRGRVVLGAYH